MKRVFVMKRVLVWGAIASVLMGAVNRPEPPAPDTQLARKEYKGFQIEEPGCDFRFLTGWFVWYVDSSRVCHTFPVSSVEEADRRAQEILEHSFSVIISGYSLGQ